MTHFYMKSDGNGGINIGKGSMAFILFLITMLSTFAAIVAYNVKANSKLEMTEKEVINLQDKLSDHEKDTNALNTQLASLNTKVDQTQKDISELKADVKQLIKESGSIK